MADERWRVTGQKPTTVLTAQGGVMDAVEVTFETRDGVTASVTVPRERYGADAVRAAVEEEVGRFEEVANLTSQFPAPDET